MMAVAKATNGQCTLMTSAKTECLQEKLLDIVSETFFLGDHR